MRKRLIGLLFAGVAMSGGFAAAEVVVSHKFEADRSGYPCINSFETDKGTSVGFNLSDYKDVWSISFFLSGRTDVILPLFDERGLVDKDKLKYIFKEIEIGGTSYQVAKSSVMAVRKSDVNSKTWISLEVKGRRQVVSIVQGLKSGGINLGPLVTVPEASDASEEFRSCALEALEVADGEQVDVDSRAEYRLIFEPSFDAWVTAMATAESCGQGSFDEDRVSETADRAASAFYPGLFNMMKRGEYSDDLLAQLPMAKLTGSVDAMNGKCLMADSLVNIAAMPVDQTIEAAEKLD